jgi:hypothetical protein
MTISIYKAMTGAHVPQRVRRWASAQTGGLTAGDLAEAMGLSRSSASQYLSRLALAGEIVRLTRGRYLAFVPGVPRSLERVRSVLHTEMPLTEVVLWSTEAASQFTHSVPSRSFAVVETARENVGSVSDALLEGGLSAVARPSRRDLTEIFQRNIEVLVMQSRNTYATFPLGGRVRMATLEKVLVDMYFLATRRGLPVPEEDIVDALRNALDGGAADASVLRRYSMRRHVHGELADLLVEG